ncbi:hypothetical protein [Haloferula sp. A504]|uniref:hypothetical protein n=1 Tax=Haloferula sp. A504 TaxID=3373601 RepID=UPI0031C769F9|nr:hypothetical protein [Verrucomicrobiaceae bacterium E54]
MKKISIFPDSIHWEEVGNLAFIARGFVDLFERFDTNPPRTLPIFESAISFAEARAEIGNNPLPEHDPSLPEELFDEARLEHVRTCVDANYSNAREMLIEAAIPPMEAGFGEEAITYFVVAETVYNAFHAALEGHEAHSAAA